MSAPASPERGQADADAKQWLRRWSAPQENEEWEKDELDQHLDPDQAMPAIPSRQRLHEMFAPFDRLDPMHHSAYAQA